MPNNHSSPIQINQTIRNHIPNSSFQKPNSKWNHSKKKLSKPKIILLSQSFTSSHFESQLSLHFHLIKSSESPLPLPEFLAAARAACVAAVLTDGWGPPITGDTVLRHISSLRCIVVDSIGTDYIDLDECRRRGIAVANAGDVYSDDCADMAVALLIDVYRKISTGDRFVRGGAWKIPVGMPLGGKRVGVVGLGSIGSKIAKRLEAFGCIVSYTSRKQKESVSYPFYSDVSKLAEHCNILVVCCELTDQTRHMINKQVLPCLGEDGIVINIARGAVVDEEELVRCLVEGKIAGVGLDVFENEPTVPTELFDLDNVVLSPHRAYQTQESIQDVYELIKANFEAFFSGKPLLSSVL